MTDINRYELNMQAWRRRVFFRFKVGIEELINDSTKQKVTVAYILVTLIIRVLWTGILHKPGDAFENIAYESRVMFYSILTILGLLFLIISYGHPMQALHVHKALLRAGFINSVGEPPMLIRIDYRDECCIYVFRATGIALQEWTDNKEVIENALNITIGNVKEVQNKQTVQVYAASGEYHFPDKMEWFQKVSSEPDIIVGRSVFGNEIVPLKVYPHFLIGGSTGSGKTVLLKFILMQCILKEYSVIISDFKGGVDYTQVWHEKCTFTYDLDELITILEEVVRTLEDRKKLFREGQSTNIEEFNHDRDVPLKHIVFSCDEVAELLDKTGMDKVTKEKITRVEGMISTIARQGRAFGIHLILATQRPDATILSGQIKNNIDYRICGRADNVLAQIILDNADAASQVPKDEPGMFLNQDGLLFKGYLFDEQLLMKGVGEQV